MWAELVAFETGAAEMAVPRVDLAVFFQKYPHRTHINADKTFPAPVGIDIHFKGYGCRQADFHGMAHGPGRQAAAVREVAWRTTDNPKGEQPGGTGVPFARLLSRRVHKNIGMISLPAGYFIEALPAERRAVCEVAPGAI